MKKIVLALSLCGLATGTMATSANAQTAVLSDLYGRGVHAYYAGHYDQSYQLLSSAITNGLRDPRAYYFRGIVLDTQGRTIEADSDWLAGAQLEAEGKIVAPIGRSLKRFQGPSRIRLENIRTDAKLQYLATASARAQQRFGENAPAMIGDADVLGGPSEIPTTPAPPAPPVTADDPFSAPAVSEPAVEKDDALEDAMNDPFADDPPATDATDAMDAPSGDPFGGNDAADPFGDAPAADGDDPFGGDDDPFAF